jgi:hypothetical protein
MSDPGRNRALARTSFTIDRICRTRTPSASSISISWSSTTLTTRPIRPPLVTTVSPRRIFFTSSWCCFTRFCCGRRIRKYMMTKMSANGSNCISMPPSPPAPPNSPPACANAGVVNMNGNPRLGVSAAGVPRRSGSGTRFARGL